MSESAKRLVDYVAVIGVRSLAHPFREGKTLWEDTYQASILERAPLLDYPDATLPPHIAMFCFPEGLRVERCSTVPIAHPSSHTGSSSSSSSSSSSFSVTSSSVTSSSVTSTLVSPPTSSKPPPITPSTCSTVAEWGCVTMLSVRQVWLPAATFVRFYVSQPFDEVMHPRAVLEWALHGRIALSLGDKLTLSQQECDYELTVLEAAPAPAVSIVNVDLEVEFTFATQDSDGALPVAAAQQSFRLRASAGDWADDSGLLNDLDVADAERKQPTLKKKAKEAKAKNSMHAHQKVNRSYRNKHAAPVSFTASAAPVAHSLRPLDVHDKQEGLEYTRCDTCQRNVPTRTAALHLSRCARYYYYCAVCKQAVPLHRREQHERTEHTKQVCSLCRDSVLRTHLEVHQREECLRRICPCPYCDLPVPWEELAKHRTACGVRTSPCDECSQQILRRDMHVHSESCPAQAPISTTMNETEDCMTKEELEMLSLAMALSLQAEDERKLPDTPLLSSASDDDVDWDRYG